jgi:hypothetical protein
MDTCHLASMRSTPKGHYVVKRMFAVALFLLSLLGVVGFTRWMPSSPVASVLADDHGPDRGQRARNGDERARNANQRGRGFGNRESADLSIGSALESLTTLGPQAMIVGAFAFSVERARRRRNLNRRAVIDGATLE